MGHEVELFSHVAAYDRGVLAAGVALDLDPLTTSSLVTAIAAQDISARLSRMVAISARTLRSVVEGLGATNETLQSLAELAANPAAVRSEELRRRAAYALEQGWNDEAADDLRQAVETNPYDAVTWYLLARALYLTEQPAEAGAAYAKAARYGAPRSKPFAAFSLLAAAAAFEEAGNEEVALKTLRQGMPGCAPCPDLLLAIAIRSRQVEDLAEALALDPSLVIDAAAAAIAGVDEAAQLVLDRGLEANVGCCRNLCERLGRVLADYDVGPAMAVTDPSVAASPGAALAQAAVLVDAYRSILLTHRSVLDELITEPTSVRLPRLSMPTHMPIGNAPRRMSAKQASAWKRDAEEVELLRYSAARRAFERQEAGVLDADAPAHARWQRNVEELTTLRDAIDETSADHLLEFVRPTAILL